MIIFGNMNPLTKKGILPLFFLIMAIAVIIIILKLQSKQSDQVEKRRIDVIGSIKFKGKVINSNVYDFAGKKYYMICVQLDTCNVKSFYVLNNLCALKIKNNIATLSGSVYNPDLGFPEYVEINMNNDGKTKFHFKDGSFDEFKWLLHTNGLTEKEMSFCN